MSLNSFNLCLLCLVSQFGCVPAPLWLWNGRNRDHGLVMPPLRIPDNKRTDPIKTDWYTQTLDHFDTQETRTWKQKYLMNPLFGYPGGPGFLQFGGEGITTDGNMETANGTILMDWMKNAKIVGATTFYLEHRYYGDSMPVSNSILPVSNMKYLSSQQALADAAQFIKWASRKYNLNKWIVFGGSYSGSLAAWMRQMYPDVVVGAISSSGPVQAKVQYSDYLDVTGRELKKVSDKCYDETKLAFEQFERMLADPKQRSTLAKKLNVCHDMNVDDPQELAALSDNLSGPFMTTAQYGGDNRPPYDTLTVRHLCDIMVNTEAIPDRIQRLLAVGKWVAESEGKAADTTDWQQCLDNSYVEQAKALNEPNSDRGWHWQCCTELGVFQTTDGVSPFGRTLPLDVRMKACDDTFGLKPDVIRASIDQTNRRYGGNRNYNGTNVVLVNGSQDPWYPLGIWNKQWEKPGQTVVFMQGQAHCSDMYPARANDTKLVIEARKIIAEKIQQWLK